MKVKRFNENYTPTNEEDLVSMVEDTISSWLDMRRVPYQDDYEIDPDSVNLAAQKVIEELKSIGVDFDLIFSTKKYNL